MIDFQNESPPRSNRLRIEDKLKHHRDAQTRQAVEEIIGFERTPADLKTALDPFIIGQEQGKKVIATAIAFHYRRLGRALKEALAASNGDVDLALSRTRSPRANILLIGPSGCGKTYTGETASRLVGVAFVHQDLTRFSEVGYVGQDAGDILLDLLLAAGGNPQVAQMGMVYLDEIDKIAGAATAFRDVSGRGVQKGLLRLVDGADNTLQVGKERITLSTRHVLFIAGGAFESLQGLVEKRPARQGAKGDWRHRVRTDDLVAFGMERQLLGRFPVRVFYDSLTTSDLKDIMTRSADSVLLAYMNDLKAWSIDLEFTDDALDAVARQAAREGTGARGLTSILHRVLLDDMFQLPGSFTGSFQVDARYVREKLE